MAQKNVFSYQAGENGIIHFSDGWKMHNALPQISRAVMSHFSGNSTSRKPTFNDAFRLLKYRIDAIPRENAILVFSGGIGCILGGISWPENSKIVLCIIHFRKMYYTKNKCIIHFCKKCIIEKTCIMYYTKNNCIIHNTWPKNMYFPI